MVCLRQVWICTGTKEAQPAPVERKYTGTIPKPTLKKGSSGTGVENWQKFLNWYGSYGLKVDGIVGIYTWKAMGFTKKQWLSLGGYASPNQGTIYNTKAELIEIMIDRAYDYLGDDYVIGASGAPGKGIDCSGLVMQALFAVGIDMTPINPVRHAHVDYEYESANIWKSPYLKHVPYSDRKRGDIVIYQNSYGTVIHSAIYLGNNMVIESWPNKVMVSNITASFHSNVKGILRVFN